MPLRFCMCILQTGYGANGVLHDLGMHNASCEAHSVATSDWPIATVA
jgi:hypothetical protein